VETNTDLYDVDFYAWLQQQAALLKARQFAALDLDNLIDEVESLVHQEHRLLQHRLDTLVEHLYTWWWNREERCIRWAGVIRDQRHELAYLLEQSPSLAAELPALLASAYGHLRKKILHHTPQTVLPDVCPWTPAQVLDEDFWPDGQTLEPSYASKPRMGADHD
jgi:hypothetical protein